MIGHLRDEQHQDRRCHPATSARLSEIFTRKMGRHELRVWDMQSYRSLEIDISTPKLWSIVRSRPKFSMPTSHPTNCMCSKGHSL